MSTQPTLSTAPRDAAGARANAPDPWFAVRVEALRKETRDIVVFDLALHGGGALPPFTAGAHLEVRIGEMVRHYSLCGPAGDRHCYRIAVQREAEGRGGSARLCGQTGVGATLMVRGPFNHFPLQPAPLPPLLLAGGIGITPLLGMALELMVRNQDFELHYSGRALERMAFVPLLCSGAFGRRAHLYADDGKGAPPLDLARLLGQGRAGRHLYVCGPGGMIDAAERTARGQGWSGDHIHFERFGAPAPAPRVGEAAFEVEIASSGRRIPVAADQSVAQALAAAGVHIPVSCEAGVCGSCRTRVLAGVPDHRDLLLSPEEQAANDMFTPCCSRAKTPLLVLDL